MLALLIVNKFKVLTSTSKRLRGASVGREPPVNPLEPRPPGPETVMPLAWGSDRRDEVCASERENRQTARGGPSIKLGL